MAETTKSPDDESRREGRLDATASALARARLGDRSAVQVTLLRALDHVKELEPRHEGTLLAYWRRILMKLVRAEASRTAGLPEIPRSIPIHAAATKNGMWFYKIALKRVGA